MDFAQAHPGAGAAPGCRLAPQHQNAGVPKGTAVPNWGHYELPQSHAVQAQTPRGLAKSIETVRSQAPTTSRCPEPSDTAQLLTVKKAQNKRSWQVLDTVVKKNHSILGHQL